MDFKFIAKIVKKIKIQPSYLGLFLLDILIAIIYFPKYLYHRITNQKIIGFDWGDGTYRNFYLPLLENLYKIDSKIIFFFKIRFNNQFGLTPLIKGLPRIYGDFLDNKIIICAASSKYKKLGNTVRIQIFHGLSSFGGGWQRNFIDDFDVLFLATKFQWHQCLQGKYKKIAKGKKIFKIGYPKIDKYLSVEEQDKSIGQKNITLFYGPTYHREISSIFEFLPAIVQICEKNNYKLIVKLHPFLYYKHSYDESGGIDWTKRILKDKKKL